jgi:hypothetical protein
MADDEMEEGAPADSAAGLATAMIVLTTIVLIAAVIIVNGIASDKYGEGLF